LVQACKKNIVGQNPTEQAFFDEIGKAPDVAESSAASDQLLYCRFRVPENRRPMYDFLDKKSTEDVKRLAFLFRRAAVAYRGIERLVTDFRAALNSGFLPQPTQSRTELEQLIRKQSELFFLGSVAQTPWNPTFALRPTQPGKISLFTFSKTEGACSSYVDPKPPANMCKRKAATDTVEVVFEVARLDPHDLSQQALKFKPSNNDRGIAYRVPAPTTLRVLTEVKDQPSTEVGKADALVAQLGTILTLPASLGGFSTSYTFKLDDATGALRSTTFGSKALVQKSMIDSASANANALLDARRAQEKTELEQASAAAKGSSVSTELERRKALLQNQLAIMEACTKLGLSCDLLIDSSGNRRNQ
jgi:hypothetical protein